MNECIFLFHIIAILVFTLLSFRLGKMALGSWLCIQVLCANLFVMKQVVLFGFHVTCSDVFAIGSILSLNLLQEYFGPKEAKKTTITAFTLCFSLQSFLKFTSSMVRALKTLHKEPTKLFYPQHLDFYLHRY